MHFHVILWKYILPCVHKTNMHHLNCFDPITNGTFMVIWKCWRRTCIYFKFEYKRYISVWIWLRLEKTEVPLLLTKIWSCVCKFGINYIFVKLKHKKEIQNKMVAKHHWCFCMLSLIINVLLYYRMKTHCCLICCKTTTRLHI